MFSMNWETSPREFDVIFDRDVAVIMSDGTRISVDIFRPASDQRFPGILGVHAYDPDMQSAHAMPVGIKPSNAPAEAGDPRFYARRGYVHVIMNARGTGRSEGRYSNYAAREVEDIREVIAWMAEQPWCTGKVGMFGASYFSVAAKQVAATNPPALAAVWAMYGYTDFYRDKFYHGGILNQQFLLNWAKGAVSSERIDSWSRRNLSEEEFNRRLGALARDPNLMAVPEFAGAIRNPDAGGNALVIDVLMNPVDNEYWAERSPDVSKIKVPIMLGACWAMYGLHLPAEFRAWNQITAPKKMIIGPGIYLDRPIYQYAYESLRWFDHWLKGNDTGYMDEEPIKIFLMGGEGRWLSSDCWPLPQTKWHPFYLHRDGLLSEHEFWPNEGATSFENNVFNGRGGVNFVTPPLVERTEVLGPAKLDVYVSTTDEDVHLFVSLWDIPPEGDPLILTRGWLKGSMRAVDESRSTRWAASYPMTAPTPMEPDVPHRLEINIHELGHVFKPGHRIGLKVSSEDLETPLKYLDVVGQGHQLRRQAAWISIHHDSDHPSTLHLPIISGNCVGTFMSGGDLNRPDVGKAGGGGNWQAWNR